MHARFVRWLDAIRTGFWFVPMLMVSMASGLALLLLALDNRFDPGVTSTLSWAYSGGPEGARSLLSTVAGSMITAASVTFSLAAVSLSISSQQYGSRVLRNFMRDRTMQVLLGTFVSTFIYSVFVVRAIRGSDVSGGFVPAISVTVAIGLSFVSLILLVYFIHHVSSSIQASQILRVIADDLEHAIPRLYPSDTGDPLLNRKDGLDEGEEQVTLTITASGYLQSVELDELLAIAAKHNFVIELLVKPGDHLIKGDAVARVWRTRSVEDKLLKAITEAFLLGGKRTPLQDIRYQFQQLTDVVIRALSQGINDPFTAINGLDELANGMALLSERARVARYRQDKEGCLRLIVPVPGVSEILEETVGHVAIYGAGDKFVMAGLRRVLETVEHNLREASELATLARLREDLERRERAAGSLP